VFTFLHNIIGHYFPKRFVLLYPAYLYLCIYHVTQWICSDSIKHRTLTQRVLATAGFYVVLFPLWAYWLASWSFNRLAKGGARHNPQLAMRTPTDELPILTPAQTAPRRARA
jgi:hypothetical protein